MVTIERKFKQWVNEDHKLRDGEGCLFSTEKKGLSDLVRFFPSPASSFSSFFLFDSRNDIHVNRQRFILNLY